MARRPISRAMSDRALSHAGAPSVHEDSRWTAVATRDAAADGRFVFAVKTTGVYCRPSCASRRPRRENVVFYRGPEAAEGAGYRACKRCRPKDTRASDPALQKVRRASALIDRALAHGDEHVIKFTEACLGRDALDSSPAYPAAVANVLSAIGRR